MSAWKWLLGAAGVGLGGAAVWAVSRPEDKSPAGAFAPIDGPLPVPPPPIPPYYHDTVPTPGPVFAPQPTAPPAAGPPQKVTALVFAAVRLTPAVSAKFLTMPLRVMLLGPAGDLSKVEAKLRPQLQTAGYPIVKIDVNSPTVHVITLMDIAILSAATE